MKTEGKSTRTNLPGVFAAGDLVDTPTARPSRPPAPAVRPRSTPSGTCATTPLSPPPPRSKVPATWRSSSGRPPRARSGGARRRGPCGLRRRRRRTDARPADGAGHDRVLHARLQGRRGDPEGASRATARASRPRSSGAALPAGRDRARAGRRGPRRARRHLHPLDGLGHRRLHRRRPGARRPVPGGPQGGQELGRQGRLDAALPARGRRRPPLHVHASTPSTRA